MYWGTCVYDVYAMYSDEKKQRKSHGSHPARRRVMDGLLLLVLQRCSSDWPCSPCHAEKVPCRELCDTNVTLRCRVTPLDTHRALRRNMPLARGPWHSASAEWSRGAERVKLQPAAEKRLHATADKGPTKRTKRLRTRCAWESSVPNSIGRANEAVSRRALAKKGQNEGCSKPS